MNRLKYSACVVVLAGGGVVLGAQAGTVDKPADTKAAAVAAAPSTMTVTGCVAKASERGHYRLTNAQIAPSEAPAAVGTTGAPTLDKPTSMEHPTSYALNGEGLKAHVGHKVEVTGTTAPVHAIDTTAAAGKPTVTPVTAATPTIDVASVKMLSSTCS